MKQDTESTTYKQTYANTNSPAELSLLMEDPPKEYICRER